MKLQAGMTLAIEPMINIGRPDVAWTDDDWTVVTDSLSWHIMKIQSLLQRVNLKFYHYKKLIKKWRIKKMSKADVIEIEGTVVEKTS